VRVELAREVDGPVVLLVDAESSSVRVRSIPHGAVRVSGYKGLRGEVGLYVEERGGARVVRLAAEGSNVRVEAPLRALGVVADASSVRVEAASRPLEYLSVRADSSGIRASVALSPGGGVYARLDSSAARIHAAPAGPGEYWVDVDADSSGFTVEFAGEKEYILEERRLQASRLTVAGAKGGEAKVRVRAWVRADSSSIRLL
jgi:hypothetical protein